ncbi:hypothetical protein DFA_09951 [Cavenderia fasciculata]|uniref:protein-tyrosine-phosphatase n=1 Tax=Cavenderia fasciculata TaxID=261658 RepID=F4Q8V8_CACFS|nr:uncharacterized protein DFA_09951 [Cavenderia fasciculata]EGG15127.1 hypothetical protein DFA_09951 [Cavenderia fasciculata]|eukprot:XP_004351847.1 hypothetical protein DFA_09951 [Cavenderia fasciculata]
MNNNIIDNDEDIHQILPRFYLGSVDMLLGKKNLLKQLKVTHILSAINDFRPKYDVINDFKFKIIDIMDMENANIKQHFEDTFEFIEQGRNEETDSTVFVHCFAGVSRSATISIAYLMRKQSIGFEEAYAFVLNQRRVIYPNNGFIKQLLEYELQLSRQQSNRLKKKQHPRLMNTTITTTSTTTPTTLTGNQKRIEKDKYYEQQLETKLKEDQLLLEDSKEEEPLRDTKYCCKKCSTLIFFDMDLDYHIVGQGYNSNNKPTKRNQSNQNNRKIQYHQSSEQQQSTTTSCTSYFIKEVSIPSINITILTDDGDQISNGKVVCKVCKEKLGSWNITGSACSCGTWIQAPTQQPCIQIIKSRVDEK